MPTLSQSLPQKDLAFLRIIASLWGLELTSPDPKDATAELAEALCDAELVEEMVTTLPAEGRAALDTLVEAGGRIPWSAFSREFGDVREMGPGRRDREQPHQHPINAAEVLWYRALVARAFFDAPGGPQEFAYVPDDLLTALEFIGFEMGEFKEETSLGDNPPDLEEIEEVEDIPDTTSAAPEIEVETPGRPATPAEKARPQVWTSRLLDDACTLLAALRAGLPPSGLKTPERFLHELLLDSGMVAGTTPKPEPIKNFLETPRLEALFSLQKTWKSSLVINDLRMLPGISCEGDWKNEPLVTREFMLDLLSTLPAGQWWSLPAFVRDIKQKYPDFQRPAGNFDTWYIKRDSDGAFLRGFASWEEVDGALLRYFITGPLAWLGLVELAFPEEGEVASAFRLVDMKTLKPQAENGKIKISSNGKISVPRSAPRTARYQVSRFCDWEDEKNDEYRYRISTLSLARAKEQGLKIDHLLKILQKYSAAPPPPAFQKALYRWETNGTEARVETLTILKLGKPEVLAELRSKAGRFLGEQLGPVSVVIKPGAESKIQMMLAEMGLLVEGKPGEDDA